METDFYIERRGLASYFEKEWFDQVLKSCSKDEIEFEFRPFNPSTLYCDYHEKFVGLIHQEINRLGLMPKSVIEIGSSLGRTFYEVCNELKTIQSALLIEPSNNLANCFQQLITSKGPSSYPTLKGNRDITEVQFDSSLIQKACSRVDFSTINLPFEKISTELGEFDLVICSNVIDQCKSPTDLVSFSKKHTRTNGILAISCTYQWSKKHLGDLEPPSGAVNEMFRDGWTLLKEDNLPYGCRVTERHWNTFLSQVLIYQKTS